jgi:hypothetical protein
MSTTLSELARLLQSIFSENNRSRQDFRIASYAHSDRIINIIESIYRDKNQLTNYEISLFIEYMVKLLEETKIYQNIKHIKLVKWFDNIMIAILDHYTPTSSDVMIIIELKLQSSFQMLIMQNYKFSHEHFGIYYKTNSNEVDLKDMSDMFNMVDKTKKLLETLCQMSEFKHPCDLHFLNELLYRKIVPTPTTVEHCFRSQVESVINTVIHAGGQITQECLQIACKKSNIGLIKKCQYANIHFDSICFENTILYTKRAENINEILNLMINDNYCFTKKDIIHLIAAKINMDYEKFKIDFDKDLMIECSVHGFYPSILNKSKLPIECLLQECKQKNNLKNIQTLITLHGLKPNQQCLYEACSIPDNETTIEFLMDYNLKLDWKCIDLLRSNYDRVTSNRVRPLIKMLLKSNYIPEQIQTDDSDDNEEKYDDNEIIIESEKKDVVEEKKIEKKPTTVTVIEFKQPTNYDFQKDYDIKTIFKKQFKLKESKQSFLKMRQFLIQYLMKQNLCYSEDKKLIRIDSKLSKIFDVHEDHYVEIFDLDQLVMKCFQN